MEKVLYFELVWNLPYLNGPKLLPLSSRINLRKRFEILAPVLSFPSCFSVKKTWLKKGTSPQFHQLSRKQNITGMWSILRSAFPTPQSQAHGVQSVRNCKSDQDTQGCWSITNTKVRRFSMKPKFTQTYLRASCKEVTCHIVTSSFQDD